MSTNLEKLVAAYIAGTETAELALSATPEALSGWAAKHMASHRYDSDLAKLVELMFKELDWQEVINNLNSQELIKQIRAV